MNKHCKRDCKILWQIMSFWQKIKSQHNRTQNQPCLPEPGIEPRTSRTTVGCVTSGTPSQQKVSMVVKLFNCFNAMVQNVNKHSKICGPHMFMKFIFSVIFFTCMDNYIWQFLIFTLLKYGLNISCKQFWP